jgi:serine/threonine-protein kinase
VAVDGAGNVYVIDTVNHRVLKLPAGSSAQVELAFTGLGTAGSVAVDAAGNLYVTDHDYDPHKGSTTRVLKLPAGSAAPIELPFTGVTSPGGAAVDAAGNV